MDFKSYYINQAGNGLPYFVGSQYQKGYGLGGVFRNIFRWIMPIVRDHAIPVAKSVGKELLRTATNVAQDTLNGEDFKQSTKKRLRESFKNMSEKIHQGEGLVLKTGLNIKNTKRKSKSIKKKFKKVKKRKQLRSFEFDCTLFYQHLTKYSLVRKSFECSLLFLCR